jgi:hypothetical protein
MIKKIKERLAPSKKDFLKTILVEFEVNQNRTPIDVATQKVNQFLERKKDQYNFDLINVFDKKISDLKENYSS